MGRHGFTHIKKRTLTLYEFQIKGGVLLTRSRMGKGQFQGKMGFIEKECTLTSPVMSVVSVSGLEKTTTKPAAVRTSG